MMLSLLISFSSNSQITPQQEQNIDKIFLECNQPWHPGGAIGDMVDGKTVYSKAFGLASLEYLVPNTPHTHFNNGPVSKQLTQGMEILRSG